MEKRSVKKYFLILVLSVILITGLRFSAAENLNLKINGIVNNISSDVYLKTNSNAVNGVDSYDMIAKDLPSGDYSQFYSSVSGNILSIDSWNSNSNPRTIYLVYHLSNSQSGTLDFSWQNLAGSSYNATFIYYGTDSTYTSSIDSINMRTDSSYDHSINGDYFYAKVIVENYSAPVSPTPYCGDGNCSGNETCSTCASDCGTCPTNPINNGGNSGGGGGGGGGGTAIANTGSGFNVSTDLIQISVKKGESTKQTITIKNTAKNRQDFVVSVSPELKDLFFPNEYNLSLDPGEERNLSFTVAPTEDVATGVYTGTIDIKSENGEKTINVVSSINDKSSLFDVSIKIPDNYKQIKPGDDLFFDIKLTNFGETGRVDVSVNYMVKDFQGNIIGSNDETIAVETQASISRSITIPADSKLGDYVAIVNIQYQNNTASSSDMFKVVNSSNSSFGSWTLFIIIVIIIIIIVAVVMAYLVHKKIIFYRDISSKKVNDLPKY